MKWNAVLFLLAFSLVIGACKSTYIPNQMNVPLMSEGDEFQVGMSAGTNGYGAQLAYSPYYHWAIAVTGNTFSTLGDSASQTNVNFRHLFGEALTGYYTRLDKLWRLEILAGVGTGYSGHPENLRQGYNRFVFQPSLGISAPYFDIGFTPKISYVNRTFNRVNNTKSLVEASGTFMEPTLTIRAGYEELKFQLQGGYSFLLGGANIPHVSKFITFGFHINLTKDFDKYVR